MRIAVFEPLPRICGVTAYTFHLAQGFRDLGHHCDVVSFTKSGRKRATTKKKRHDDSIGSGWHWWMEAPDVVTKWDEAREILNGYDLIVLNEPKNGSADREAQRLKVVPEYVRVMEQITVPWITVLHAPQYDNKRAPFLEQCLAAPSFTGIVMEHQPGSYDSRVDIFSKYVKTIQPWPWLPYRQRGRAENVQREAVIGIGGRMTPNKGHATLAYYSDQLPEDWSARMFGGESGGQGPSYSFILYEALVTHHGWSGTRFGTQPKPNEIGSYGDTISCWRWWLQKNGHLTWYMGGYDDILKEWTKCGIALNLTSREFAVGLEYTSLEAMDAGCAVVLPAYSLERTGREQYAVHVLEQFSTPISVSQKRGLRLDLFDEAAGKELIDVLKYVTSVVQEGSHNPEINRQALATYHDPRFVAGKMIELVGGK